MFGLNKSGSLTRKTRTGQGADGSAVFSSAVIWTGACMVTGGTGQVKYEWEGLVATATHVAFIPNSVTPLAGDTLAVGAITYLVQYPKLDSRGHHFELHMRLVAH